jgi:tetratricopeptide (TPR) repeat protein
MLDTRRLCMAIGQGIVLPLLLIALIGANSLSAQPRAETRGDQSPALIAGGNAIVNYGLTPEQVQELTKAAAAGAVGPLAKEIVDLSKSLGVTQGATLTMLRILGQGDVPLEQLPQKLAKIANQYKKFEAQLAALNPQNPMARDLVEQAQAEIKAGNADSLIKAHQLLGRAKQVQIAAAQQALQLLQQAQAAHDEQLIQAAASSAAEGHLAMTELHYLQAAELFKEAANLVPPVSAYDDKRTGYLQREAGALYQQGDEFGDNSALRSAIERHERLLELQPRARVPLDWATTQNNLGIALATLGERESGTARLEQAVAAYRAALEEMTRARVPLDWATTQNNLGAALRALGARESGTARLEEAVAAYRAALEERTRPRVPLDWAATQNNLGGALWTRVPVDWLSTVTELGYTRFYLGDFTGALLNLQEAVANGSSAYPILWLYLADARIGGQDIKRNLQNNSAGLKPAEWPFPVIELFLDRRTPADMLAAAAMKPDEQCEAQYYLGEWYLLRNERAASIEALRKSVETCPKGFIEFAGAVVELKRLGN